MEFNNKKYNNFGKKIPKFRIDSLKFFIKSATGNTRIFGNISPFINAQKFILREI